jgi:hypothetical protein
MTMDYEETPDGHFELKIMTRDDGCLEIRPAHKRNVVLVYEPGKEVSLTVGATTDGKPHIRVTCVDAA